MRGLCDTIPQMNDQHNAFDEDERGDSPGEDQHDEHSDEHSIAILSMACRFPGANGTEQFWKNLAAGVESITFWSDEELRAAGVPEEYLRQPGYVRAGPVLEEIECFDAAFFDMSPREAEILDPQSRIFLEVCWEALERAGYVEERYDGWIGVYAGTSFSSYQMSNLMSRPDVMANQGWFPIYLANDRDYFTTRISYKLDLKGPSVNLQTACSTSLVAVHHACQSLLDYQCTLALAGGVRIGANQVAGYLYEPGGIMSPDGHCRSFDAGGNGSLFGNGAGVVLLKRLEDALADGDHIEAVIRGSAINNDGAAKVGFTAPSVEGQAEVVAMAQTAAGVAPEEISYVEAHGSATALGDPIEVAALKDAFGATAKPGTCALGSVKSNFGHLEAAAGVAGLIKTVLALRHRQIPPSLWFETPNPQLELEESPFYVNTDLRPWRDDREEPLRAGVSSFGMGGTNAHVILEEAPARPSSGPSRPFQLVLLSARTATALDATTTRLGNFLRVEPQVNLADLAFTLSRGRRSFEYRRILVCRDHEDTLRALDPADPSRLLSLRAPATGRAVTFLLPGLGEHYPEMTLGLYRHEALFRREIDRCAKLLHPLLGRDLREVLYPRGTRAEDVASGEDGGGLDLAKMLRRGTRMDPAEESDLHQTRYAQPAVFVVEYALAQLWKSWGLEPQAMIGHSLGEYVAACLAGVFTLEDALALVAERARLIDQLPAGAMLAVTLAEAEITPYLGPEVSLAAVNGPQVTVVSGSEEAVGALAERLREDGVLCQTLPTTHAFHSYMMEPVSKPLVELLRGMALRAPEIPMVSNVTGTWLEADEARDPEYWARHLCRTVRFDDGVTELLRQDRVLLEVGPGQGLGALVMQHPGDPDRRDDTERTIVSSLRGRFEQRNDQAFLLEALGRLWLAGVTVDWKAFWAEEERHRIHLPTYPFERRRFWIDPPTRPRSQDGEETSEDKPIHAVDTGPPEAADSAPSLDLHQRPNLPTAFQAPRDALEEEIVALWQEVLGIAPIGVHDSYFDMGGHSLLAPRLVMNIERALEVTLPLELLLEHPTVAKLSETIRTLRTEGLEGLAPTAVDLHAEVTLAEEIRPSGEEPRSDAPQAVFLTGGTGFLGAYLLRELFDQSDAQLLCLVRAADGSAAFERLRANLEHHRVWHDGMAERINAIPGDLAQPLLGLSDGDFERLAHEADLVIHAGAWVNFIYPYSVLEAANVESTRETLRFATTGTPKPVHFISSTAVFTPESYAAGRAAEDDPLEHTAGLFSGYAETKWVSEKILALAEERGIPVAIYRPGVISGDSETGVGNTSDMVWNVIKGCIELGSYLDPSPILDVTPVDFVARAVVYLALHGERSHGRRFGFANPRPMPYAEIFAVATEMGYSMKPLDYSRWRQDLLHVAEAGGDNALVPFLPLFEELPDLPSSREPAPLTESRTIPSMLYDDSNLKAALEGSDIRCPPLDVALVKTYMDFFIASGFIDPPPDS